MRTVRTTVALPEDLVEAADRVVREGKARSRNDLLALALRHELAAQERAAIHAGFAAMADDQTAQAEALAMADGGPQVVTRRGERSVVLMSAEEYRRLTKPKVDFKEFLMSGPPWDDLEIERSGELPRETEL